VNYYEHHIGDYAEATAHLSFVEDAAYSRLIRKYYATERPLPADVKAVQRLVIARTKEERDAVEAVLHEFFDLHDDGWHQKRCDVDLQRYLSKQEKARASANARWSQPHSERNANASAPHMRTRSERNANASETHDERNALQSPVPSNQTNTPKPPNQKTVASPDGFAEFWERYPKKVAKPAAEKAFRSAKLNGHLPEVLADIDARTQGEEWAKQGGKFIPNPATYLNQRRWEDGQSSGTPDWIRSATA
jgi:uncharacterized protein YdaU (DUF1376 family)